MTSAKWSFDRGTGGEVRNVIRNPDGSENVWTAFSHSGNERNRLFLNQGGKGFTNVSGVSGADSSLDGRTFVTWDFNHDGRSDLAGVNANQELLKIFKNQTEGAGSFLAFRLTGNGSPSGGGSNRDAIGARITVSTDQGSIMRVLSCGEGFAAVNSRTVIIGLGEAKEILSVMIHWPSGDSTTINSLSANKLVEVAEKGGKVLISNY